MRTFQFHLKNGKTHELTFPDGAEFHRAIICVPKSSDDKNAEAANCIILPDDIETIEFMDND